MNKQKPPAPELNSSLSFLTGDLQIVAEALIASRAAPH